MQGQDIERLIYRFEVNATTADPGTKHVLQTSTLKLFILHFQEDMQCLGL